ncbi:MAG: sugar ABC transporter ATP-binding protein [Deltaproteobacteria bacterium]|nr:sugar ABC transporter ATP-binding protein [Deltaproteobacteria bacterium]
MSANALTVSFGATTALDDVSLDLRRGEVHALVGENGAGKSTLLRVIAGLVKQSAGAVRLFATRRTAYVPQETDLPIDRTVGEWLFMGRELKSRLGLLRRRQMEAAAERALHSVGTPLPTSRRIGELTAPQRKQVQLARAVSIEPEVFLLDEPTAVLAAAETTRLFDIIRCRRSNGAGILYVSHRIEEVLAIADRVTVLRDGRIVSTEPASGLDVGTIVKRMVGREIPPHWRSVPALGTEVLRLTNVVADGVKDVSLSLRAGEVVGLAGLMGSGRSAVLELVAGLRKVDAGSITGAEGAVLVPEDRAMKGLVATMSLRENIYLPAPSWRIRRSQETVGARQWIEALNVRACGPEATIESLSGGNQQKVLLARALRTKPRILLLDEPTVGVDVAAKVEIHGQIRRLAAAGTTILLASSDLPELLALCDRIVALREGVAIATIDAHNASEPQLAALITGARTGIAAHHNEARL